MSLLLIIFGLASGSLFSILVGLIGSHRRIGFGWAFILSILLTPLVGLIITLLSDPIYDGSDRGVGCVGIVLAALGLILLIPFLLVLFGLGATLLVV